MRPRVVCAAASVVYCRIALVTITAFLTGQHADIMLARLAMNAVVMVIVLFTKLFIL